MGIDLEKEIMGAGNTIVTRPRNYPNFISAYENYCQYSEAPAIFHRWTAVSIIAGALQRKVWVDQKFFQWTPNFYIIFVAPPGIVSKSTTASIGMNLLRKVHDVNFGPASVTWQALTQSLSNSCREIPDGEGGYLPMSCITISSSEFGTFLNPADKEMVDVMVDLWDGQIGVWEKATKTQGNDTIINPWINLVACTTPAWISGNFPDYMIGGGFTSRCMFVYAEEKRKLVAYPGYQEFEDFSHTAQRLIEDLEQISLMVGEYRLSPEALEWGEEWYKNHYEREEKLLDKERFGGYLARKQTHIHKTAIVLAAAESNELIIQKSHLVEAEKMVTELEAHMPKVFGLIGRSQDAKFVEAVKIFIEKNPIIDKSVLVHHLMQTMGLDEINRGLDALIAAGQIKQQVAGSRLILQYSPVTIPSSS